MRSAQRLNSRVRLTNNNESGPLEGNRLNPEFLQLVQLCVSEGLSFVFASRQMRVVSLHQPLCGNITGFPKAGDYSPRTRVEEGAYQVGNAFLPLQTAGAGITP